MRSKATLMLEIPGPSININLKNQPGIVVGKEKDDLIFTLPVEIFLSAHIMPFDFCHHQKIGQIDIEHLSTGGFLCYHKTGVTVRKKPHRIQFDNACCQILLFDMIRTETKIIISKQRIIVCQITVGFDYFIGIGIHIYPQESSLLP